MNSNESFWQKVSHWFENGDLVPLAVLISVGHYGPVLMAHGENWLVAWAVGTLMDLLHFRAVRWAFHKPGVMAGLVAIATTVMAAGYHFRFYNGDLLLALPIPLGIAVLAWQATATKEDYAAQAQAEAAAAQAKAAQAQAEAAAAQQQAEAAQVDAEAAQVAAVAAHEALEEARVKMQRMQRQLERLQKLEGAAQQWEALMQKAGPLGQGVVQYLAGQLDASAAAELAGVHPDTVKRNAARLNGVNK